MTQLRIRRFNGTDQQFDAEFRSFLDERRVTTGEAVAQSTEAIVSDVRERGGVAVAEWTAKFENVTLDPVSLKSDGFDLGAIASRCPDEVKLAIDHAAERIAAYHEKTRPADGRIPSDDGIDLSWQWTAIDSVGLYVPGGRASYPSSVLMNAIPAQIAGVRRLVMVSPTPGGELNSAVAYAAVRAGVSEFYQIGGAQAVAALAYGAGELKPVHKIVGPGNAYVAAAKRIVFGQVGIDTIAGPSELTVVADKSNRAEWVAADLLSQAEHDPVAQSILITDDPAFADMVVDAMQEAMASLSTAETARQSIDAHGAVIIAPLDKAAQIVNIIAPEHVEVCTPNAEEIVANIRHAGAIFVGPWASEALGDYATGSNHVLPTSGAARFASGLSTADFMKRTSIQRVSQAGFNSLASSVETLARSEGFPAHALSVSARRGQV